MIRKMWTYKGVDIYPADINGSGMRWYARTEWGLIRSDTKVSMRVAISSHIPGRRRLHMDPNETLRRIRELIQTDIHRDLSEDESSDLLDLVNHLDKWITNGGFLPTVWNASHPPF